MERTSGLIECRRRTLGGEIENVKRQYLYCERLHMPASTKILLLVLILVPCLEIECQGTVNQQAHPLSLPYSRGTLQDARSTGNQTMVRVIARNSKQQAEEEDGFIMKSLTTHESRATEDVETTTTPRPYDEQVTATNTEKPQNSPSSQLSPDDDRIPINANRQQFVTHDQLLNASTKDEQVIIQPSDDRQNRSPPATAATSSRSAMPRLAFASSFLSDLLFRKTTAGGQQAELAPYAETATTPQGPAATTFEPYTQTATHQHQSRPIAQQQQHSQNKCPGTCLNLFSASLRCRNAIPAPCPSVLQKCCEVDDVSFNGTPVETSAPLPTGDLYPSPTAPHADVQQNTQQVGDNEQASVPANVRPEAPVADKQTGQQRGQQQQTITSTESPAAVTAEQQPQVSPSLPANSRLHGGAQAAAPPATATEKHDQVTSSELDSDQSRSVYFLSSGVDSNDAQHSSELSTAATATGLAAEQNVKSLDPKRQQLPTVVSAQRLPTTSELAQSPAGDNKSTASQSFDPPLTTTTTSKPADRVVAIQTANGTAYLHSGQSSSVSLQSPLLRPHARPLYANWSDYHLLMMHSRPPANQPSVLQPVVYHSNIDPVRRYGPGGLSETSTPKTTTTTTNDLTSTTTPFSVGGPDSELKVLKDQHSATSMQRLNNGHTISHSTPATEAAAAKTTTTTTAMPTTTSADMTTAEPQYATATTTMQPDATTGLQAASGPPQGEGSADGSQQADMAAGSPVSGIANFLGTLFASYMSGGDDQNEARGTSDTAAAGASSPISEQHNDRRLGLDMSFRQQGDQQQYGNQSQFVVNQDGENLMTSDESPSQDGSQQQQQLRGCEGYCALDQFLHLCDSHYPSRDCRQSQKCCVSSATGASPAGTDNQQQGSPSSPSQVASNGAQVCRGSCLPMHYSSLCTKPNIIMLESPSCLPEHVCCSRPSIMVDGNNNLEDTSDSDSSATSSTTSLAGVFDGSSSKDHSLSVALVPAPPPTVGGLLDQSASPGLAGAADGRHPQPSLSQLNPFSVAPGAYTTSQQSSRAAPTVRPHPYPTATTKATNSQQATTSGGIMNQIFNMFKSSGGSSKQRARQPQPQQPQRPMAPQHIIYEMAQQPQQPVYHLPHTQQQQQMATSASGMRPTLQSLPNQQIIFPPLQQVVGSAANGPNGPILIAPNPSQSYVPPNTGSAYDVSGVQKLPANLQMDQAHYYAEQMQLATALQAGQMNNRPQQQHQQPARQVPANQFQLQHQLPSPTMAPNEQQQHHVALMNAAANQLNYMNQHQQQQHQQQHAKAIYQPNRSVAVHQPAHLIAPQNPVLFQQQQQPQPQLQQLPTRWTHPGQSSSQLDTMVSSSNNNAQRYHQQVSTQAQPSNRQQQPQFNHVKPGQQLQHHSASSANSLSFGPADAASTIAASSTSTSAQYPPQSQILGPIMNVGGSGNWQQSGWLGSSSPNGHTDSLHVSNTNLEQQQQQQRRQKLPGGMSVSEQNNGRVPTSITHNKAHQQPEADTNTVSALTNQQSTASIKPPPAQASSVHNQALQPGFSYKPAQQQPPQASLPKIVPTSTTTTTTTAASTTRTTAEANTELPPVRTLDNNNSKLFSSSSNLKPIHAPVDDSSTEVAGGDLADSSQPQPVSSSSEDAPELASGSPVHSEGSAPSVSSATPQVMNSQASSSQPSDNDPAPADDGESGVATAVVQQQQQQPQSAQVDILAEAAAAQGAATAVSNSGNLLGESTSSTATIDYYDTQGSGPQDPGTRGKVSTTACGLPGPNRLSLNSVAARARSGRVMGGFDAEPGYWCWQAALMNGKNEYLCGGALIGTKWVLTAAHCVTQHLRSESQLYVRLGQTNLNSSSFSERRSAKSLLVKTSYVHHNHNGVTLDNDIALLRLEDSVDLGEPGICTVCLPERNSKPLEVGRRCTVTGYGYENEQGPAALRVRQTDLPIVGDDECQSQTSKILQKPFVLPASSFCAGGELGQDACHGDGGSPLACQVDGYYELTGIVSWGYKCGSKDLPGLYAKVSNFVGWINQIVSVNS